MTENTVNVADKAANEEALSADDLNLIGQADADAAKSSEDIWNEIENEEAGLPNEEVEAAVPDADKLTESEEPPAAVEAASEEEGADTAATAAEEQTSKGDIWAEATPEQREALAAHEQYRKSNEGRVAALQRQVRNLQSQLSAPPKSGRQDDGKEPVKEALSQLKALSEDLPDIAPTLASAIEAINSRVDGLQATDEGRQRAAQVSVAESIKHETDLLHQMEPGWSQYLSENGAAYQAWAQDDERPAWVQKAAARNWENIVDAEETHRLLTEFKKFMGAAAPVTEPATESQPEPPKTKQLDGRQQRRLDALDSPRKTGSKPVVSGIPEEGDPEAIWEMMEAAEQAEERARA